MSKKREVTIVNADDWKGLYIDGKLVFQNHSIRISDLVECLEEAGIKLGFELTEGELTEDGYERIQDEGCLPDDLEEVDWQ